MNSIQQKLFAVAFVVFFPFTFAAPASARGKYLRPQAIFSRSKGAVIQVITASSSGTGFIVSPDGLIVTANHVVTSRLFEGNQVLVVYTPNLRVVLPDGRILEAEPATPGPPLHDWIAHDFALLKVKEKNLPYLDLASWSDAEVGDEITAIGYAFTPPVSMYIAATVSGREAMQNPAGIPALVNAILFQAPINKGMSGAPLISNRSSKVVGIVNTKLAGVPNDLYYLRDKIEKSSHENSADRDKAMLDVINVLDQSLISGMGGAVAIDYASEAMASVRQKDSLAVRH